MILKEKKTMPEKIAYYKIEVETMVGDGDRYPVYTLNKKELVEEDKIIIKYYQSSDDNLDDNEYEIFDNLYYTIKDLHERRTSALDVSDVVHSDFGGFGGCARKDFFDGWGYLLFHWDGRADDYEEIQEIRVTYFDENGKEFEVEF